MEYGGMASPYLSKIGPFSATGTPFSVSAGRLSFTFGLKGPAVSLTILASLMTNYLKLDGCQLSPAAIGLMLFISHCILEAGITLAIFCSKS